MRGEISFGSRVPTALRQLIRNVSRKPVVKEIRRVFGDWRRRHSSIAWGDLRRLQPVSRSFGLDRGQPIDRFYIENFLQQNATHIAGEVLEVGDDTYTRRFGGARVTTSHVLHALPGNPAATLIGNLESGESIPKGRFSCMLLTQTFFCIYDVRAAIRNSYEALATDGVLLATLPGICQISRYDMDRWGDFWRFTNLSARRLFGEIFGEQNVEVKSYGNVLAATAFLQGLASSELRTTELDFHDPDYEVLITVRAVKRDGLHTR